jgi:hypothetical protein
MLYLRTRPSKRHDHPARARHARAATGAYVGRDAFKRRGTAGGGVEASVEALTPQELRQATGLSEVKLTTALTGLEAAGAIERLPTGEVVA